MRDIHTYIAPAGAVAANRVDRRRAFGTGGGRAACARVSVLGGTRGGNEARAGGSSGDSASAVGRRARRGRRRRDWRYASVVVRTVARRGGKNSRAHARYSGVICGPAGGRRARAHLYVLYYYYYHSHRRRRTHTHTHAYIIIIRGSRRSHVYTYYTYNTAVGCVPRVRSRGGVNDNGRVCVRMGGSALCVVGGVEEIRARARTHVREARALTAYILGVTPPPPTTNTHTHRHSGIARRRRRRRPSHPPDSRRSRPSDLTRRGPRRRFFSSSPRSPSIGGPKSRAAVFPARFSFPFRFSRSSPCIHAANDERIHIYSVRPPPRSLRANTKKQYRAPSMLNYRTILYSFFCLIRYYP